MGASILPMVDLSLDLGRRTRRFLLHVLLIKIRHLKTKIESNDPRPQTKKEKLNMQWKDYMPQIATEHRT